ncbi:hypothetical protein [Dysgonomonas termitidis]|uniref:Lipoprotein n=1 Tax=Dysgonomonas termitidis TaxID=1516126 RepID=A0ABV9KS14_9BACT
MNFVSIASFSLLLIVLASCNTAPENKQDNKIIASYKIIYDSMEDYPGSDRHTLTIGIDSALTLNQLYSISDSIIRKNGNHGKSFNIAYRMADQRLGYLIYNDLYAETKMDSVRYETVISREEKDNTITVQNNNVPSQTKDDPNQYSAIGSWQNDFGLYDIFIEDGVYYLKNRYIDGSGNTEKLSVKKRNGQLIFNVEGDDTEYFIIKRDGLYIYDSFGELGTIYKNRF